MPEFPSKLKVPKKKKAKVPAKRRIKTAVWYDPFGSIAQTTEEQIANDVKYIPRVYFDDEVVLDWYEVNGPHAITPGTELLLFDFGGMSFGNSLMESHARQVIQFALDNPNVLILVTSSYTFRNAVDIEMCEQNFASLPNVVNMHPDETPEDIRTVIPDWFHKHENPPARVHGGVCERCHRTFDDKYVSNGRAQDCIRCGQKVCGGCIVDSGNLSGYCGDCAGWEK